MTEQDAPPEGLMLAIANAHDDTFRWKVAAAVVQNAQKILSFGENPDNLRMARYAVWNWTEVGEVFARYLSIAHGIDVSASDDEIVDRVRLYWHDITSEYTPKE